MQRNSWIYTKYKRELHARFSFKPKKINQTKPKENDVKKLQIISNDENQKKVEEQIVKKTTSNLQRKKTESSS